MPNPQDRKDLRRRKKSLRQTKEALLKALDNSDGIKRVEAVPETEWDEAQKLDDRQAESEGE